MKKQWLADIIMTPPRLVRNGFLHVDILKKHNLELKAVKMLQIAMVKK